MTTINKPSLEKEVVSKPLWGRAPLFVLIGSFLLYFFRFGYDYANSDQDEIIPFLLHRMDPSFFTQDWFVQTQTAEISVRTYSIWLLEGLSLLFPVWLATLLSYIGTWLIVAGAVYALAYLFTEDKLASAASVVITLVLTPMWTLGGNDLVHSMMVPSMLGWGLGLWAIYHFLLGRYLLTPVLIGMACWVQALVGLQVATLLILYRMSFLFKKGKGPHTLGGILLFCVLFLLYASPALGPLVYQQFTAIPTDTFDTPSLFYIMAAFRMPHHYLFFSFPVQSIIRFGLLAVPGLVILLHPRLNHRLHQTGFIGRAVIIIGIACCIGFVFTEIFPFLVFAKLQLFKLTVLAKLLFVILICSAVFGTIPTSIRKPFDTILKHPYWGFAVMSVMCVIVVYGITGGKFHDRLGPLARSDMPTGKLEQWAKTQTPHDAIFSIPPSFSSFRSGSQRTIVVNFKAVPYTDREVVKWFKRLLDMAPIELPERGGSAVLSKLDDAYNSLSPAALLRLSERYKFGYLVRENPFDEDQTLFNIVFKADPWIVYQVRNPEPDL